MGDGTEFDDTLLGLPGFRVLAVTEDGDELLVGIETIRRAAGCLRHTTAMCLLHAGVDPMVIALWLGHERIETTNVYVHADITL
jgi:integrase